MLPESRIEEELRMIRKDLDYIKEHMVDKEFVEDAMMGILGIFSGKIKEV